MHLGEDQTTTTLANYFTDIFGNGTLPTTPAPKGAEGNTSGMDVTKCDPNVWYPDGSPCDLIQDGVDIGTALALKRQQEAAKAKGTPPAGTPKPQWIKGVDNTFVMAAAAGLAFLALSKR
jgi:hypothetical protein